VKNGTVYRDVLRRLESLELKQEDPVKIFYLFRLPDGTEVQKRAKEGFPGASLEDIRKWEKENKAEFVTVIVSVKD